MTILFFSDDMHLEIVKKMQKKEIEKKKLWRKWVVCYATLTCQKLKGEEK